MVEIPQSTARRVMLKLYITSTTTAATGKTLAITISKNGAAFTNPAAGATNAIEISGGWYYVDLGAGDSDTLGDFVVKGTATGCDDSERFFVVAKATNRGMTAIPDALPGAANGAFIAGTNASLAITGAFTATHASNDVRGITAATVSDKTGYSLSSAGVQAIWDAMTSALTVVGSIGKWLIDKLDVVVSTRAAPGAQMDLVNAPNQTARDAIATTVESHLLDEGDSQMLINAIVGAIGNVNIDQTVLVAAIRADLERSGGNLYTVLDRLTAQRAANLDNLDDSITSVLTAIGTPQQAGSAVTLPTIPTGWITAGGIASGALNSKGNWSLLDPLTSGQTQTSAEAALAAYGSVTSAQLTDRSLVASSYASTTHVAELLAAIEATLTAEDVWTYTERELTGDVPAVLVESALDAVIVATGLSERFTNVSGDPVTTLNARQALAILLAALVGDRSGLGTREIVTNLPGESVQLTAERISRSEIESTVVVPD